MSYIIEHNGYAGSVVRYEFLKRERGWPCLRHSYAHMTADEVYIFGRMEMRKVFREIHGRDTFVIEGAAQ